MKVTVAVVPPTLETIENEQPAGFPIFVNVKGPVDVTDLPLGIEPWLPATATVPKHSAPGLALKIVPFGTLACVAEIVCAFPLAKVTTVHGRPSTCTGPGAGGVGVGAGCGAGVGLARAARTKSVAYTFAALYTPGASAAHMNRYADPASQRAPSAVMHAPLT